jgi:hypothetical protein
MLAVVEPLLVQPLVLVVFDLFEVVVSEKAMNH